MSTQTGIKANDQLREFFAKCRESNGRAKYRMIKVVISNEVETKSLIVLIVAFIWSLQNPLLYSLSISFFF